jgi:hypothetical protein
VEDVDELPAEDGDDALEVLLFELDGVGVELGLGRELINDQSGSQEQKNIQ